MTSIKTLEEVSKKKVVSVHFGSFFEGYLQSVGVRTSRSDFLQLLRYTEPEKKIRDFLIFFRIFAATLKIGAPGLQ